MSSGSRGLPGVQVAEAPGDSTPIRLRTGVQGHETRLPTPGSSRAPPPSGEPELRKVTRPGVASRHPGGALSHLARGSSGRVPGERDHRAQDPIVIIGLNPRRPIRRVRCPMQGLRIGQKRALVRRPVLRLSPGTASRAVKKGWPPSGSRWPSPAPGRAGLGRWARLVSVYRIRLPGLPSDRGPP